MDIPINSNPLKDRPQFAVVVNNPQWGWGIFSMHITHYDAKHNSKIVDGQVLPIDWVKEEYILPPLAFKYLRNALKQEGTTLEEIQQFMRFNGIVEPFVLLAPRDSRNEDYNGY